MVQGIVRGVGLDGTREGDGVQGQDPWVQDQDTSFQTGVGQGGAGTTGPGPYTRFGDHEGQNRNPRKACAQGFLNTRPEACFVQDTTKHDSFKPFL